MTGDSFKLAKDAAARPEAEYIVFCGVHFMAESADILTGDDQKVVLPDLAAGCSMADMATAEQVAECWDVLTEAGIADQVVPVSYMNSSADIKAFTGRHGGTICTSSNAERALNWAFEQGETKVLFLPDQHLGRNTAVRDLGMSLDDCVLYNPHKPNGGLTVEELRDAKMILWRGHCSVHGRFSLDSVNDVRERIPGVNVLVHPECKHEVVAAADYVGSTEYIIKALEAAPARLEVGDRHRAEPGAAPGQPFRRRGQGDRLPRQDGLLLLDHEPHRPAAPGVDAGVAGRGQAESTRSRSTRRPRTSRSWRWSGCWRCRSPCPARRVPAARRTDGRRAPTGGGLAFVVAGAGQALAGSRWSESAAGREPPRLPGALGRLLLGPALLAELDHRVERRDQQQRQQRRRHQTADHHDRERLGDEAALAGDAERHREQREDRRQRRHQDRAQPVAAALDDRLDHAEALRRGTG